jgi:hypothetical protein
VASDVTATIAALLLKADFSYFADKTPVCVLFFIWLK